MSDATVPDSQECGSCGHEAPGAEMIPELTASWQPTGGVVCRDPDACYRRRLARDRERMPPGMLRDRSDALRGDGEAPRYCHVCRSQGNDGSRLGVDRVHNVEGAPPEGMLADVCENGHVFEISEEEGVTDGQ